MIDVANSLADSWFRLGFLSYSELETNSYWVTTTELYQFGDDAAKKMAYGVGIFLVLDDSIEVEASTAVYSLPPSHVFTILAWLAYSAAPVQLLRLSTVGQLFALDASWAATTGSPVRASMDAGSVGTITLYPIPTASATVNQVCQEYPGVSDGNSQLALSPVMQDAFTYALLAGARGKESDARMQDMADHFAGRVDLYTQIADHLWGPGQ